MAKDQREKNTPDLPLESVAKTPHVNLAVQSITAKMAASGIGKDRENTNGPRFKFRGIDDIFNVLAKEYVADKIIILPAYSDRVATEYESKGGGRMVNVAISGTYRLVSLVDGSELVSGPFVGEAMDSSDKATNKAMSIAYKYFAIQTFAIPVVGDEDPDGHSPQVEAKAGAKKQQADASAQQPKADAPQESVADAIARLGGTKEARAKLKKLITGAYDVVLLDDIDAGDVPAAIKRMEEYVAKAGQKKAA